MAWQHIGDRDLTVEREWPTWRVTFADPSRFKGWQLDLSYVALSLPSGAPPTAPFPVALTEIAVRRFADAEDAPPLTPSKLKRLDIQRAWEQAQRIAEDKLRGAPEGGPRLPAGYPHRGPLRESWYRELLEAVEAYAADGLAPMEAYQRIADRKHRDIGTVKRWVHDARRMTEEDVQ